MGEGYVFIGMCHSVHRGGGVARGGCVTGGGCDQGLCDWGRV